MAEREAEDVQVADVEGGGVLERVLFWLLGLSAHVVVLIASVSLVMTALPLLYEGCVSAALGYLVTEGVEGGGCILGC